MSSVNEAQPNKQPKPAKKEDLAEAIGFTLISPLLIVGGIEIAASETYPTAVIANYGAAAVGVVMAVVGAHQWHDYFKRRDAQK